MSLFFNNIKNKVLLKNQQPLDSTVKAELSVQLLAKQRENVALKCILTEHVVKYPYLSICYSTGKS